MNKLPVDYDQKSVLLEDRKQKIGKIIYRFCKKCGERKPLDKFSGDKRSKDGRINICKACRSLESLNYYYQNRERILLRIKQYDEEHKDQKRAYSKTYRDSNSEHLRIEKTKYYRRNRKRIKKRNLQRKSQN